MKWMIYSIFIAFYLFITFYGLGPALFADGSKQETMITFGVVIIIEVILSVIFLKWMRRNKMNKWFIYPPFLFIIFVFIFFKGWNIF
jgi:hypothetical protein